MEWPSRGFWWIHCFKHKLYLLSISSSYLPFHLRFHFYYHYFFLNQTYFSLMQKKKHFPFCLVLVSMSNTNIYLRSRWQRLVRYHNNTLQCSSFFSLLDLTFLSYFVSLINGRLLIARYYRWRVLKKKTEFMMFHLPHNLYHQLL